VQRFSELREAERVRDMQQSSGADAATAAGTVAAGRRAGQRVSLAAAAAAEAAAAAAAAAAEPRAAPTRSRLAAGRELRYDREHGGGLRL
jgi:hypothetical protein